MKRALYFCAAVVFVPIVQLIPLPPSLWTALPNRALEAAAFQLLGTEMPWRPVSTTPRATGLSAMALLPPLAIFLAISLLGYRERRQLSLVILAIGLAGAFVGLMQVAQGPSSPLRFFQITNPSEAVGFFANRNHFAALLYVLILLTAAWAIHGASNVREASKKWQAASALVLIAAFTVIVVLVAAQAMTRSRAGLGLAVMALFGAFALAAASRRVETGTAPLKLLIAATGVALIFSLPFALYRVLERFTSDPLADARIVFARGTIEAAKTYMPLGAGMGSFVPIYALFEPSDGLLASYANRAHDDILELWLEAGIMGLALMALFAIWFAARAVAVWRQAPHKGRLIDRALARAATIIVALLVAHSFVDYPLRTAAMMAVFAFACGLLIPPLDGRSDEGEAFPEASDDAKRHSRARNGQGAPRSSAHGAPHFPASASKASSASPPLRGERWGEDIEWPKAWRTPSSGRAPPLKPRK